jgi:predicted ferric reductase
MTRSLLFYAAALLFPLPLVVVLNTQLTDAARVRMVISLGLIAYCWWLAAILLSVRPTWLDRWVGLPQIYALHGSLGIAALVVAYLHIDNNYAHNMLARDVGNWAFYLSLGVAAYSILFMSGWLADRLLLVARIKRGLERLLDHRIAVWLHRLNLVAVALIAVHVHLIVQINRHLVFMIAFDLVTLAVLGVYAWKKWIAPDSFLTGTVRENRALNASTRQVAIALDEPSSRIRPGDFFFLRFEADGIPRERHPFSLTGDDQGLATFTIRQIGDFTRAVPQVPVGTRSRLEGPFGRFDGILKETPAQIPLVFIGMGAGVAPLLSLAAGYAGDRAITLLWSVHRDDDAYYRSLIEDFENANPDRFDAHIQVGRFTRDRLAALLSAEQIGKAQFVVVGPAQAVLAAQRHLRRLGVSHRRIHHERLTM